MKKNSFVKSLVGVVFALIAIMFVSSDVYAEEVTKTVCNTCQAKALIKELKANGVNCDLTIQCKRQDLVDYVNNELKNVQMSTGYRPVQVVLKSDACQSGGTTCSKKDSTTCSKTGSTTCPKKDSTTCSKKDTTTCPKKDSSTCSKIGSSTCPKKESTTCSKKTTTCSQDTTQTTTSTLEADVDSSPKTGDEQNIKLIICFAILSGAVMLGTIIKRKRAY